MCIKQISKMVCLFQNINNGKIQETTWTQVGYTRKCVRRRLLPSFLENRRIPWSREELENPTS
jgi:hypothetical protein